jgi:hypothetical protein
LPKINILPFQTLDELNYQFTVLNGNNVSEKDMDRLNNLKFNPYLKDTSSHIALSENNTNLENWSKIDCEYYLPNDFNKQLNKASTNNVNFSIIHLNSPPPAPHG